VNVLAFPAAQPDRLERSERGQDGSRSAVEQCRPPALPHVERCVVHTIALPTRCQRPAAISRLYLPAGATELEQVGARYDVVQSAARTARCRGAVSEHASMLAATDQSLELGHFTICGQWLSSSTPACAATFIMPRAPYPHVDIQIAERRPV